MVCAISVQLISSAGLSSNGTPTGDIVIDIYGPSAASNSEIPADDSTGVAIADNLSITFNENIALGTGTIILKNLIDDTNIDIDMMDTTQVTISGATLKINPTDDLTAGRNYAVQIDDSS